MRCKRVMDQLLNELGIVLVPRFEEEQLVAFRASRSKRGLIKKYEISRAFKVGQQWLRPNLSV